ncbi:MAG: hypothetical protein JWQ23_1008 [Herminiimonas sp.]|nr:hypothetical protein [Herminiimonas sp.]
MASHDPVTGQESGLTGARQSTAAPGVVVVYRCNPNSNRRGHESLTRLEIARKLAAIKGFGYGGEFDSACQYDAPLYFVPSETISAFNLAHSLGIRCEHDLFGGVVPYPFVATKTITHGLPDAGVPAPYGWSTAFAQRVRDVVLPGYSVFTAQDARIACERLLKQGCVRLKKASGIGGLGQAVITDSNELEEHLDSVTAEELLRDGLVFERNLADVETHSVGQVRVGTLLATYYGTQRLTHNNRGQEVYGGSNLTVVRGDFDALQRLDLAPEMRTVIAQAGTYHAAAMASFSGMFASRCNYDVAQGRDDQGQWRSGVLEQSWRAGGATGAEVAALEVFRADPAINVVNASTTEIYGDSPVMPTDAIIYFSGVDDHVGMLTKYARLESYANA